MKIILPRDFGTEVAMFYTGVYFQIFTKASNLENKILETIAIIKQACICFKYLSL